MTHPSVNKGNGVLKPPPLRWGWESSKPVSVKIICRVNLLDNLRCLLAEEQQCPSREGLATGQSISESIDSDRAWDEHFRIPGHHTGTAESDAGSGVPHWVFRQGAWWEAWVSILPACWCSRWQKLVYKLEECILMISQSGQSHFCKVYAWRTI